MPAVRVRDALRYASKFVGLVLAVTVVAGGFLAGGAYLAADAISLSDPSLSALSETPVFIGVLLLAVGVLLAVIGIVTLAYKFLADGIATAIEAQGLGGSEGASGVVTPDAETEVTEDGTGTEAATDEPETETPEPSGAPAASGDTAAPVAGEPSGNGDGAGEVDQPGETPRTSERASDPVGAPTDGSRAEAGDAGQQAPPASPESDRADSTPAEPDRGDPAAEEVEPRAEEEPSEWTPPDPSEFDSPEPTEREEDTPDADQWAAESSAEETVVDDPVESEDSAEPGVSPSGPDPDEPAEDATLADEGVESFSTAAEEDPLSDRLPGSDDT